MGYPEAVIAIIQGKHKMVLTTVASEGLMSRQNMNLYCRPMNVILVDGSSLKDCVL